MSCTYLAHHELENVVAIIIIIVIIVVITIVIVIVTVIVTVIVNVIIKIIITIDNIIRLLIVCATGEDSSRVDEVHMQHHNLTDEAGVLMQMRSLSGRRKVLHLFINLTRWLHTVHTLCLLPPPPPARLMEPFCRRSPYNGNHLSLSYDAQLAM